MNVEKLIRPNILSLTGYSSARDEYSGNEAILLDANENPFASEVNRYPDPYQRAVKKEVSKLKEINENNIFLGNGSDEAIDLIMRICCEPDKDNIVITDPTYGMYQVSAGINNLQIIKAPLNEDFSLNAEKVLSCSNDSTNVIFICSPNNPSGNVLAKEEIINLIEKFKGIVVVDEAYIDFSDEPSFIKLIDKYANLIVLQTFSKAWGMAGIRLGMAFASSFLIELLNKVKPPYNINALTQQYALTQLKNPDVVKENIKVIVNERKRLETSFKQMKIVDKIFPSDGNFLLVKFKNAEVVFNLLLNKNIIVRDRSKVLYGDNCLRITVGTKSENDLLIKALEVS